MVTESRRALVALALFILAIGLWDYVALSYQGDTFLPPSLAGGERWVQLGDWSVVQCYPSDWKTAVLGWACRYLPESVLVALTVFLTHALLWSGIFYFERALFGDSPWVALLGVVLVRICPDLFQVHLLSLQSPSRVMAVALAFWSVGLAIRRRWVVACCAAGLIAHFSATVACWFAQFIVVTLLCLNYEWGWRKSLTGAACFLVLAAGPLVRFLIEDIVAPSPLPSDAMIGLHFFADPTLSPFSVPLWANVCLVVYLAMAFVWLKRHFNRRTTPIAIIFFLLGLAGILLEIMFVGLIPIERAARFELPNMRAFWLLWIAAFCAPALADEIRTSWEKRRIWRPTFRAIAFSLPVVWSALTLVERLVQPPRWNRVIVFLMLGLLVLTAFVLVHGEQPIAEPLFAFAIAMVAAVVVTAVALVRRKDGFPHLAFSLWGAIAAFALVFWILYGRTLAHAISNAREIADRNASWTLACQWVARHSPAGSTWSVPWRPRQFRQRTGRAVLINRDEVPWDPSRRFEWFQMYAETHGWPGGATLQPASSSGGEKIIEWLREYRRSFLLGAARRPRASRDWLVCSSVLPRGYGVTYAICDQNSPPQLVQEHDPVSLEPLGAGGSFLLYKISLPSAKP